jgi:hypothetical protein
MDGLRMAFLLVGGARLHSGDDGLDRTVRDLQGTRRVRFVRGEGRGVSDLYGVRDAACPICTG